MNIAFNVEEHDFFQFNSRLKDNKEDTHLIITSLGVPLPPFHLKNRILQAINPGFFSKNEQ